MHSMKLHVSLYVEYTPVVNKIKNLKDNNVKIKIMPR